MSSVAAGAAGEAQIATAAMSPRTSSPVGSKGQAAGGSAEHANPSASRGSGQGAVRSILSRIWPGNSPSKANGVYYSMHTDISADLLCLGTSHSSNP